jgi:hypothetical protein
MYLIYCEIIKVLPKFRGLEPAQTKEWSNDYQIYKNCLTPVLMPKPNFAFFYSACM